MRNPSCQTALIAFLSVTAVSASLYADQGYLDAVPFTQVTLTDPFWSPRIETNRTVTIPFDFKKCEETHRIRNFEIAAGLTKGKHEGSRFNDSDVFKVIEGAAYSLRVHPDPKLEAYLDDLIDKIADAQEDDGYLYTIRTIDPQGIQDKGAGNNRWTNLKSSHELYNMGHLYEAAVAYYRATGKRKLLDVAIKSANLFDKMFGPDMLRDVPGHEEIELALVKLFQVTDEKRYLNLADFFIAERGCPHTRRLYGPVFQDHKPIAEQDEVVGHAVRAMYFYTGVADVARITGNQVYLQAMDRLWQDLVGGKLYVTGGIGAVGKSEKFGDRYFLPNDTAYAETCAAIGLVFWSHRMNLLHRDGAYFDVLERSMYNGALTGVSLDGQRFFYVNPLESDGKTKFNHGDCQRQPWFKTACCPTNIARWLPSIGGYVYATDGADTIYVNLYADSTSEIALKDKTIQISQQTRYPWDGKITLNVQAPADSGINLMLRIPGWSTGKPVPSDLYRFDDNLDQQQTQPVLNLNGKPIDNWNCQKGYVALKNIKNGDTIELTLPMPVRRIVAHPNVEADTGKIALQRGPIVYCLEQCDSTTPLADITLPKSSTYKSEFQPGLLGGVTVVKTTATVKNTNGTCDITAVPYYSWNNRGIGPMKVWLDSE